MEKASRKEEEKGKSLTVPRNKFGHHLLIPSKPGVVEATLR